MLLDGEVFGLVSAVWFWLDCDCMIVKIVCESCLLFVGNFVFWGCSDVMVGDHYFWCFSD